MSFEELKKHIKNTVYDKLDNINVIQITLDTILKLYVAAKSKRCWAGKRFPLVVDGSV